LKIGDYILDKDQLVLISLYAMGRDGSYFANPDEFNPTRWRRNFRTCQVNAVENPFASLPFSLGARSCIGKKMAVEQMEYFIEEFFKRFHLSIIGQPRVNMMMKMIGLPDAPINFTIKLK
jgi:ecdysteroid 2-hydroxylase